MGKIIPLLLALMVPSCEPLPVSRTAVSEISIVMDSRFTPAERSQIRSGGAMWEKATHGRVKFLWSEAFRPEYGVRVVRSNEQDCQGFLGLTTDRTEVLLDPQNIPGDVGLAAVSAHEFGHVMGLHHSQWHTALMSKNVHAGMYVTEDDVTALKKVIR